ADELRRCWIKDRIGLVQDPVETRCGHLRAGLNVLDLTVAEPGVVPPAPIKELVPLYADGAQPRVSFVIEQTVSKLSQTRAGAARDNLLEWIKRIECVRRNTGFRVGWCVGWFRARRNRRMRRNSQYRLTLRFERTSCWRRQFVVRRHVLVKAICIDDHLIAEDLVVTT